MLKVPSRRFSGNAFGAMVRNDEFDELRRVRSESASYKSREVLYPCRRRQLCCQLSNRCALTLNFTLLFNNYNLFVGK